MAKVLVVEDEPDIADLIEFNLIRHGFDVIKAQDGFEGVVLAQKCVPDMILLDIMMPKLDGFGVLQELQDQDSTRDIPVIMLTAKAQVEDRIKGLDQGVDDYLSKPFSPKELILRIKSVLKRSMLQSRDASIEVGPFKFDTKSLQFFVDGQELELTMIEFKLMLYLCERKNQVQDRFTLLKEVWGYNADVHSRTLDTHLKRLRQKLGEYANYLETVRGEGYRIVDHIKGA